MSMSTLHVDVVIVGAGIAGAALALALGSSPLSVALIEAQPVSRQWPDLHDTLNGFDARVSALTKASQQFLTQLNVWPLMAQQRISAYRYMHVWDAQGTASINFDAHTINQPELGHIVENRLTVSALVHRIVEHSNIQLIDATKVECVAACADKSRSLHKLTLSDGRQLCSSLIVAADGANSRIRELACFTTREWDYGHNAIVATVQTREGHRQTAWQRFLPQGPLAFLPLKTSTGEQHFCSIVWSALPQYADNLMSLNEQAFMQALGEAFECKLGDIVGASRRFCFPLRQRHAVDYVKPGIALIGDAAHTIHPLAGQGINLGLMDARVLAEELLRADRRQLDVGDLFVLQRFARRRKTDNLLMMATMEGFKRLFERPELPVRWARNAGMHWLDKRERLKHKVMRAAMGL